MAIGGLDTGSIQDIMSGAFIKQPVMQILKSKKIFENRYRVILSDGRHFLTTAVASTEANTDIFDFTLIRVKKYCIAHLDDPVQGKVRALFIPSFVVATPGESVGKVLGFPKKLTEADIKIPPKISFNIVRDPADDDNGDEYANKNDSANWSSQKKKTIIPISSVRPFTRKEQNTWVIRARVVNKTDIRSWSNARSTGQFFNADLMDESGEIRFTAFTNFVHNAHPKLQVDKVYYISGCQIKPANKQFSSLAHNFELNATTDTIIEECQDETAVPEVKYNFVPFDQIQFMKEGSAVDIIGVCKEVSPITMVESRINPETFMKLKLVTLVDQSKTSLDLALFKEQTAKLDGTGNPVVVIKSAKVSDFEGGRNVTALMWKINPDIPECHELRKWYDSEGRNIEFVNVNAKMPSAISDVKPEPK